jgi:UDP-N-acetylmuramyl tripeptide synthase
MRDICFRLPGLHNVYNALGAAALGTALGIGLDDIAAALETAAPTWGRGEHLTVRRRRVTLTYLKNPVGANAIFRALTGEPDSFDVLGVTGHQVHHGQDFSWLWDTDFETLAPHVGSATCSGLYGGELALRLKYAGVPPERIVIEPDVAVGLDHALMMGGGRLHGLCTSMSALYELRAALLQRQSLRGRLELRARTLLS